MKRTIRSIIFLFSLFFLISTAFSCQKKFHAQLNNMASCNEGILFPVALDSIEFLGWHDFNAYSDDGSAFSDDDSVIFCIRFEKIFLLFIASFFTFVSVGRRFSFRNKFNKITLRNSTVF